VPQELRAEVVVVDTVTNVTGIVTGFIVFVVVGDGFELEIVAITVVV
jgi:hypothetical protein